jgi:hypothetical protein
MTAKKTKQLSGAQVAREQRPGSEAREVRKVGRSASLDERLGWRIPEWISITGTSRPTLWRQVKRGDLKLIYVGPMPIVPRSEAIRLGLINS